MEKQYEAVLVKLYDAAKKVSDHFMVSVDIGIRSPNRKNICLWLETNEYIENVSYHGKTQVRCHVTDKTFEYFKDKV